MELQDCNWDNATLVANAHSSTCALSLCFACACNSPCWKIMIPPLITCIFHIPSCLYTTNKWVFRFWYAHLLFVAAFQSCISYLRVYVGRNLCLDLSMHACPYTYVETPFPWTLPRGDRWCYGNSTHVCPLNRELWCVLVGFHRTRSTM